MLEGKKRVQIAKQFVLNGVTDIERFLFFWYLSMFVRLINSKV